MNQIISAFLEDRKATWLKSKQKSATDEASAERLIAEAEEKFSLPTWLPDAARRAGWLSMVSHPGKFSHPSAKTSTIIANSKHAIDGFLRTGNVEYQLDVFGNAAAMDVYRFLCLKSDDGLTVLQHLENDSPEIKTLLNIPTTSYENLKSGFLSIKQIDNSNLTDKLVKQVYFPIGKNYHLLSILTPSGLLTQLKNRIDEFRFSEKSKSARESRKLNELHTTGFDDIYELTVMGYGGTKPQNISVLNNQNYGQSYLLLSVPPELKQRQIRLPHYDFFKNTLNPYHFKEEFLSLNKLMALSINNINIREGIENLLENIIEHVLRYVLNIRSWETGWSNKEHYQSLPLSQKIWLDDIYEQERLHDKEWIREIAEDFARWMMRTYQTSLKDNAIMLSDHELNEIRKHIEPAIKNIEEFLL